MVKKVGYKILISIILLCTIFQYCFAGNAYAVPVDENGNEIQENIDENENQTNADDDNLQDEVDDDTGTMLQPLLELIRVIGDAVISTLSKCMLGTKNEKVMVKWDKLDTSNIEEANTIKTFSQEEIDEFKDAKGNMLSLKYPQFRYTPEEIFKGEIDLFSIDFIGGTIIKDKNVEQNTSEGWNSIREMVSTWYKVLRHIAVVGLLSILIYLGIMIIFSSSAGKKAEYKNSLINWVVAMIMLFSMHYIMAFVITIIQKLTSLLGNSIGNVKVIFGADKIFVTNFMGLARFQAQQYSLIKQIIYIFIYISFISLTFKFTLIYLKRMLSMAMLTIFAPLIAMMYPLDKKGSGKSRIFGFWIKEYTYNALLQPMHLLLYDLLIGSAVQISVNNPIYIIVALFFLVEAEKIFKKIFGFGRAAGANGRGLAGTMGAMAMASSITNGVKSIRKELSSTDNSVKQKNNSNDKKDTKNDYEEEEKEDAIFQKRYGGTRKKLDVDTSIFDARKRLTDEDFKNIKGGFKDFDGAFNKLKTKGLVKGKNKEFNNDTSKALRQLEYTIERRERPFLEANKPLQYNDEFSNFSSNQLLEMIKECLKNGDTEGAQKYYDVLKRRMLENKYMESHGGPKAFTKGRLSNITDTDLQFKYNEAKKNGNKVDMLECEAEMALREKKYDVYEVLYDELEKEKQKAGNGSENKGGLNATNGMSAQKDNGKTSKAQNEKSIQSTSENVETISQKEDESYQNANNHSTANAENTEKQNSENHISNPFAKLFRKSPNKSIRNMSQKKEYNRKNNSNVINNNKNNSNSNNVLDRMARQTISGVGNVLHEAVKPVWDTRKKASDNLGRIGATVARGAVQTTLGVTSTVVQAGISMADGKYTAKEAIASFTGGVAAGRKLTNAGEKFVKGVMKDIDYGASEESRKNRIAKDWAERDDVKKHYKETYGYNSNKMLLTAQDLVKEGITDIYEQQKIIRYANYLRENHQLDTKERALKQSVQVFKFRRKLDNTYGRPIGEEARNEFIDQMIENDGSTKTKESIKIHYTNMLNAINDFERVEDNEQYNYYEDKR